MSLQDQHIAIAGAGIIGLSAALAFREAGARVTVFESGRAMEQSSWAAAGMLAVDDPENDPRLLPLSRLSRAVYPEFLRRVEELSGLRVPLRTSRTLQGIARGSRESAGQPNSLLPGLVPGRWRFEEIEEAGLDPRDLCAALPPAAHAAGVELREQTAVTRAQIVEDRRGVSIDLLSGTPDPRKKSFAADHFILAAGAWSAEIFRASATGCSLPIVPRKGQMLEVRMNADAPALPVVIRTPELYLVPRGDGRVAIGSTVEDAGFDRSLDPQAGQRLLQQAAALWPPILRSTFSAEWTGLRPGSADPEDALPLIGPIETGPIETGPCDIAGLRQNAIGIPRVWAATGHFRNGILLAPGTAHLLRAMLEGLSLPVYVKEFSPTRGRDRTRS